MDYFKWSEEDFVLDFKIINYKEINLIYYIDLSITFNDFSQLLIKEYIDENHRKYSFHWQDMASNLILRWDNAPHHKQISTFPHHRHLASGDIKESFDISFDEIMEYIRKQI